MPLYLDNDRVPGYDHRVSATEQLEWEDQSGERSGSNAVFKGWKSWMINVTCRVRFIDALQLKTLRELFQARDADGRTPKLYTINDLTANTLGVVKVRFADNFSANPDDKQHIWNVKFALIEDRGIPPRTDERLAPEPLPQVQDGFQNGWIEKGLSLGDTVLGRFLPKDKGN
jgi:hypothetical protein